MKFRSFRLELGALLIVSLLSSCVTVEDEQTIERSKVHPPNWSQKERLPALSKSKNRLEFIFKRRFVKDLALGLEQSRHLAVHAFKISVLEKFKELAKSSLDYTAMSAAERWQFAEVTSRFMKLPTWEKVTLDDVYYEQLGQHRDLDPQKHLTYRIYMKLSLPLSELKNFQAELRLIYPETPDLEFSKAFPPERSPIF